jgi:hypothetical protein
MAQDAAGTGDREQRRGDSAKRSEFELISFAFSCLNGWRRYVSALYRRTAGPRIRPDTDFISRDAETERAVLDVFLTIQATDRVRHLFG